MSNEVPLTPTLSQAEGPPSLTSALSNSQGERGRFELRLEGFRGPLELLLNLIEKRKLPITAISLAAVADQYLAHIRAMPELDPDLLSDFLVIAAKLLVIKSRAILPAEQEPVEGEEDPAEELAARLEEYRTIRSAAEYLQSLERRDKRCYPHPSRPAQPTEPVLLQPIEPSELVRALTRLLERQVGQTKSTAEVQRLVRASVEARIALIAERLAQSETVDWTAIAGNSVDEVVATFLALLEMLKRGVAMVEQAQLFGPLVIRRGSSPVALRDLQPV